MDHQWFGDLYTCKDSDNTVLNDEGFATVRGEFVAKSK